MGRLAILAAFIAVGSTGRVRSARVCAPAPLTRTCGACGQHTAGAGQLHRWPSGAAGDTRSRTRSPAPRRDHKWHRWGTLRQRFGMSWRVRAPHSRARAAHLLVAARR